MSYVTENNETYRNMQEQVLKNAEDIAVMKQGPFISYSVNTVLDLVPLTTEANYGKYILVGTTAPKHLYVITHRANEGLLADDLGEYPAKGETGETGETGATGPQGTRGPGVWTVGSTLPSPAFPYIENDIVLITAGSKLGQAYRLLAGQWLPVASMRGPQGPIGEKGTIVKPNPTWDGTETIYTLASLRIDGLYFQTEHLSQSAKEWLATAKTYSEWDEDGSITFGHDVTADGNVVAHNDVEVGRNLYVDDSTKIQDPDGNPLLVDLASEQTISGAKTFTGNITSNRHYFGSTALFIEPVADNQILHVHCGANTVFFGGITPEYNHTWDLGSSLYKWKDIYLSGSLKIGNTTLTEAQLIALLNLL